MGAEPPPDEVVLSYLMYPEVFAKFARVRRTLSLVLNEPIDFGADVVNTRAQRAQKRECRASDRGSIAALVAAVLLIAYS